MKNALVLCLLLIQHVALAQFEETNLYLGAKGGYLNIENYSPRYYGGLALEWQINDHWSLNYNILFSENYFQMPAGVIAGVATGFLIGMGLGVLHINSGGLGWQIIKYSVMIPGGAGYRIYLNENIRLTPYFNPLLYEYVANRLVEGESQDFGFFWGSAGIKAQFLLFHHTMQIAPFLEFRYHLTPDWNPGLSFGIVVAGRIKDGAVRE